MSGAGPITKALRDGRLRRDAPGAPAAEPEATEWRRLASAFVMGAKENEREDQGEGLQRRLCRLNSYDLGVAVDWSLKSIGGEGFWQFTPEPAPQRPVELRPLLIMGCDQASPNMCLVFALLNKFKLRMIPVFCLDHRAPNDVSDAVGQIPGLRQSLLFGRVSASLNHGPWGGKANFRQIQELGCGRDGVEGGRGSRNFLSWASEHVCLRGCRPISGAIRRLRPHCRPSVANAAPAAVPVSPPSHCMVAPGDWSLQYLRRGKWPALLLGFDRLRPYQVVSLCCPP